MAADLSAAAQGDVEIIFYQLAEYNGFRPVTEPQGQCLDQQHIAIDCYTPNPDFLVLDKAGEEGKVSELKLSIPICLRTNCPVTDQPDWASVYISYQGAQIDRAGLLKYLVSFRQHQDFHEQCVEKIYAILCSVASQRSWMSMRAICVVAVGYQSLSQQSLSFPAKSSAG